jgi:hypothetical protein
MPISESVRAATGAARAARRPESDGGRRAPLEPANVHGRGAEINLVPSQINEFADPETVAKHHQQHGAVPVTMAVLLGPVEQEVEFGSEQMLPCPILGVQLTLRRDPDRLVADGGNQSQCGHFGVVPFRVQI